MSLKRTVSNCWTNQALCFCIGVDTATPLPCTVTWSLTSTKSPSFISWLVFARVDVILSEQFVPVRQDAEVAMTSGTAEIVKSRKTTTSPAFVVPSEAELIDVHGSINGGTCENSKNWQLCEFSSDTANCHCDP